MSNNRLLERLSEIARTRNANGSRLHENATDALGNSGSPGGTGGLGHKAASRVGPIEPLCPRSPCPSSATAGAATRDVAARDAATSDEVGVEAFLPGGEWRDKGGAVFVHERLRSEIESPRPSWGTLDEPGDDEPLLQALQGLGLERALFLDLETGGLASSPVFLAGTMHWNGTDFVVRQYFARHYGEEGPLLRALGEQAARFDALVTYNGKSYDAPFLRSRAMIHRVRLRLPSIHVDLLHPARRRWKERFDDCRLQTLERWVCRRRRVGDVPGDEVPGLYHDFVRSGNAYRLVPVFHHNLLDVITMAEILRALCGPPLPVDAPRHTPGVPPRVE